MKTERELFENALDTTSVNDKKLREYINENYISNSVLDKIRAEIMALRNIRAEEFDIDSDVFDDRVILRSDVLAIIGKYKAESED